MTTLVPGNVIKPTVVDASISEAVRVLYVHEPTDRLILIPIEPQRKSKRIYFRAYFRASLAEIVQLMSSPSPLITLTPGVSRADATASDKELDDKYLRRGQKKSVARSEREARWAMIKPLVEGTDSFLLFDRQILEEKVTARALELAQTPREVKNKRSEIKRLLRQFWAGGGTPEALATFRGACGGRGKERQQVNKLGRKNAPTRAKKFGLEGYVLKPEDKDIIRFSWRNYYVRGTTIAKAYRRMCREFYSILVTDTGGKTHTELLPQHRRPTKSQFRRWGSGQAPNEAAWKKQHVATALARIDRALIGSADDDIVAIGQRAAVDSTPPDMAFVSVLNRLDRIGPAHRILVVDSMYRYIPGFYLGLDAPSSKTVKLAFLHAMTDKTEWLKFLGLDDQSPDDWIPIRFSTALADNTDLRTEEIHRSLASIGTGLLHVPVARSDLNSPVEVSHHQLHRMVDHNMLGTTYGRRTQRGEESADDRARHTIIEEIRETARAIHTHNTMPLDIVPTMEMRELIKEGVPLTRLNLTRWRMNQGKLALNLLDVNECRMKLLPRTRGVFTAHGVKLLRPDTGAKREFIEPHRYVSSHPLILKKIREAKNERGKHSIDYFDDDFAHDPFKTTEIYYRNPIDGELIPLHLKIKDRELPFESTYDDAIVIMQENAADKYFIGETRDQALSKMEAGQEATKQYAEDQYAAALAAREKAPSKTELRANKAANREREAGFSQYGMPILPPSEIAGSEIPEIPTEAASENQAAIPLQRSETPPSREHESDTTSKAEDKATMSLLAQSLARRRHQETSHGLH